MNITSEDIKILRDKSGAGMMDCKKALDESNGDIEKAVEWLRKKGISTAQKKSSRSASDGLVTVNIKENSGVILEVNAETDFVARNENFQNYCFKLSSTILKSGIKDLNLLLDSKYDESDILVKDSLTDIISKLGENIVIKKFRYIKNENLYFQKYLHNAISENSGKIGVLLSYSSKVKNNQIEELSKNICMHIAATDPKSVSIDQLDKTLIEKERLIYKEQLKTSGKPENILDKIIDGKINKFYEDVCLMEQIFVMDSKVKIKNYIRSFNEENDTDFKIIDYVLFKLGQE